MKAKILLVEDDEVIRKELRLLLEGNGYEVLAVEDFANAAEEVKEKSPNMALLDIRLSQGTSGFSICSQIRSFSKIPIIFVTSCSTDMDELNSIMLGGDAFITKPYHTAILLAKIDSLLKRFYPADDKEELCCQGAVLHLENSTLEYAGEQVSLTKNEVKILYYLFRHKGRICPRGDLVEYLWENQLYVDDNALSVNINRIREKLEALGLRGLIQTKHRQGYLV